MAILNVTPDSFSDGGRFSTVQASVDAGLQMMADGADLIDVGGESTRPGSNPVSIEEEVRRTIPVVEALSRCGIPVSIDTMKPEVASQALRAGAFCVNDVNGLRAPGMLDVVGKERCTVCIMHMQGQPKSMQDEPGYGDVGREVSTFLVEQAGRVSALGLPDSQIWIDPGIGFGKTVPHNLTLLRDLKTLTSGRWPVLLGVSRKSFIGNVLGGLSVDERLEGTLAVHAHAQLAGVRVIRAHDVKASRRVIDMLEAITTQAV